MRSESEAEMIGALVCGMDLEPSEAWQVVYTILCNTTICKVVTIYCTLGVHG